jgi:hypothetical protein
MEELLPQDVLLLRLVELPLLRSQDFLCPKNYLDLVAVFSCRLASFLIVYFEYRDLVTPFVRFFYNCLTDVAEGSCD